MYSSSESTGGGSNFPRSSDQCHEMKTPNFVSGNASASVKAIPVVHSNNSLSQFNTVPVQTQDNAEAHQAKQVYDKLAQASTYFPSKHDNYNQYAKNRASSKKEAKKNVQRFQGKTNPKKQNGSKKNQKSKYVKQSLLETLYPSGIIDQAKNMVLDTHINANMSDLTNVLENLGLLSYSIPKCNSKLEVAVQLALALKTMYKGSVIEALLAHAPTVEYLKQAFGYNIFHPQSGDVDSQDWLSYLPKLRENWDTIRCAPIFEKVSNLISVAATIGLCSVTNLAWSVEGIELFRVGSLRKHASAFDFFGAMLDTVISFIEGGYECFRQRSLKPLLFTTDAGAEFDDLYFACLELHQHALIFNLAANPVMYKGEKQIITDLQYTAMLDQAVEMAESAYKSAKGTWQASVLEKRLVNMRTQRAEYSARRIDGSLRYAPLTLYVWGESGVGKSTVAQLLMSDCLVASGADPDACNTAVLKESDKFDSTLKGDTQGIYLDDMGNTKIELLDRSPCERMIDINNNMVTYANKADLHEKGKIEIRPHIFIVTSNAPLADHARRCSIKPMSIVRRGDIHILVKVKPEFAMSDGRLDSKKANAAFPDETFETDVWDLTVYVPDGKNKQLMLGPIDGSMKDTHMNIHDLLEYACDMCEDHFENQRKLIAKAESLVVSREYCSSCKRPARRCKCPTEPQSEVPPAESEDETTVEEIDESIETCDHSDLSWDLYWDLYDRENLNEAFELQSLRELSFDSIKAQFERMPRFSSAIAVRVPTCIVNNIWIQRAYMCVHASEFIALERNTRRSMMSFVFMMFLCGFLSGTFSAGLVLFTLFVSMLVYYTALAKWKNDMCEQLASRRDITDDLFASLRQSKAVQFFSFCVVAKVIYKIVSSMKIMHEHQTALAPETVVEVEKRNAEVNPWAVPVVSELHINHRNDTMTIDQVTAKISKNLFHVKLVENGFQQSCDVLALGGISYLFPLHIFENRKDMKGLFTRYDPSKIGGTFKGVVGVTNMVPIPGKDLCIVNIPSGGVRADITHLFPDLLTVSGNARMLYRREDGSIMNDVVRANYIKNSEAGGAGYHYHCAYNTFTGLCGAVLVGCFAKCTIAGIHLRGISGTSSGKALTVTRQEIFDAIAKTEDCVSSFPTHVNGTFPTTRYEKQVITSTDIHVNSPINYLPEGSDIEYFGQTGQRASHTKSDVVITPISDAVTEVTGIERKHGPPQFNNKLMWQASLAHSSNASAGVEPSLLDKAVIDYQAHILEVFQSKEFGDMARAELKPLTDMEALCGRDGARFIDAMPRSTSKGFPLSGPKSDMITLLNPEDYPEFACPAECDKAIIDEMNKMITAFLGGKRCYTIFKACVKDEATKIGKEKVRVFEAADWAFQLIVRKYFLPIARMLSLFPLTSECAVGVNAQGPEWDQLARHMKKFGADRIFAGDYSKYDLRMPAQLILAAFKCLIDIAKTCGQYSVDDIKIMQGVATEIAYSCVSYNGDLIIHCGSNPSGQNLTVYINCIVNSLLLRCAYYHMYPAAEGNPEPFRHNCAVMTYGDDVKGSVRQECDWYNHITYAQFLAERDMVFTMPDKESTPTPYMNDLDADFLKRHNLYNPETGLIHGVLDQNSIFKSLHSVLKSKAISAEDQSAQNIDGALREWWQYGREMYELRRDQMRQVAIKTGIAHLCTELETSYDMRMQDFKEKYEL
ncbi:unknown [Marine RNA virus JP-A]|uniref:SF3 helicase domain-containing protein n=1 Tax=Marine RNA virus JP-A TaxID=439015 RepID=A7KCA0_9VIRU|nr:hypothetical protein JP-A_gp1 [Marine RNA virus JP-A]ABQ50599.1 unknown [Marine RNA virus JP-A]